MLERQHCLLVHNGVFNEIASLAWGSSILVLDDTHFESVLFLDSLLRGKPAENARIISPRMIESSIKTVKLNLEQVTSLSDLSIAIAQVREQVTPYGIIVHHYLPHLLVRESEDEVLKMLEFWTMKTAEGRLIEFYTLPHGTFNTVEKKAASLFSGEILVRFSEEAKNQLIFQIKKTCKPQYHLEEFPFTTRNDELLIKWGDVFTDHIPIEETEEIQQRVRYMKENVDSLLLAAREAPPGEISTYEEWILSLVNGKRLAEIQLLFPDRFEHLLETLARLSIGNCLRLEEGENMDTPPPKSLSFRSRLALMVPTWLSARFLFKGGRYITMDAFTALRDAIQAFTRYSPPERAQRLSELEMYYQELASRRTAVERIAMNREDPRVKFDLKYFKSVVSLTLQVGFRISPRIYHRSGDLYEIYVTDCPVCRDKKSVDPQCELISLTVRAVCGVTFKRPFTCEEIKCIASGANACVFMAKAL